MHRMAAKTRIGGWAASVALAAALFASAGPAHAEAEPVKAAVQTDRGSGRLMLEWRRPVQYTVEQSPPYVFVRFSRPLSADLETAQRALSRYLAELRLAGGGRVLVLRVTGQPRFTHYRRGNAIILSWIGAGRATPAENPTDSRATPATPPVAKQEEPAKPGPGAAPETQPKSPPPDTAAPPAAGPTLTVATSGAETRIAVAWPEPVAAAVFRYGSNFWIVFPRREAFDVAGLQRLLGPGVERLERVEHANATVLAARTRPDVRARVLHERNVWTVVLKRESAPARETEVKLAVSRGAHEQVAVPLPGAEAPIRLVDPEIGSTLHVVSSRAPAGVGGERRFVTFRLVPAVQGAVIEALADGLVVAVEGGAIVIRRKGGLLLSGGTPAGSAQHGQ